MKTESEVNRVYPPRLAAMAGLVVLPVSAWFATHEDPAWVTMWSLAVGLFLALKLLTLTAVQCGRVPFARLIAYVALWPGLDAQAFLGRTATREPVARGGELAFAFLKFAGGIALSVWAVRNANSDHALVVGWIGMIGIIFTLHFGLLHLVSWLWRRAGVNAPAIMRAPIIADSLADFWGGRWNAAFADVSRRFLFRPTVRTLGGIGAGLFVFLVSGLIHEVAISLPARGGWGGPTLYFLIQGAGISLEKGTFGKKVELSRGALGWAWMALCTVAPLPLLFHAPFVLRVIIPFFQFLHTLFL